MTRLEKRKAELQNALAAWYARERRPLPWRMEPSLYRTVVSEFMAQQTQIKTMLPYFERWMVRFPHFKALAEAPEEDVLKHWEGLGYYSRARNLHKLAKSYIAANPKPVTRDDWLSMPGVGPYTAAAISSIAQGYPAAVVDGNVVRILARITNNRRTFKSGAEAIKAVTPLAEALLDPDCPGDHNQAMMELGATVCLKRKPLCTICPVATLCESLCSADVDAIPRIERRATEQVEVARAWALKNNKLLLHQISDRAGQLAGQFELPLLEDIGVREKKGHLVATKKRSITHRRITEHIYQIDPPKKLPDTFRWVSVSELEKVVLSGPHRRWVRELLADTVQRKYPND